MHMKKTFLKIGLFAALGLTVAAFNSCKDNKPGPDNGIGGSTNPDGSFTVMATNVINGSAQITTVKALAYWSSGNWEDGDYEYGEDVIAQAPYSTNGFTLKLPATVAAKYLYGIDEDELLGVTISDRAVKMRSFSGFSGFDKDENEIGYFYLGEETDDSEHVAVWLYADRDVTIKGEEKEIDEDYNEEYIRKFDLQLKKGWNVVYESGIESTDNSTGRDVYVFSVTNKKTAGVNYAWNFHDYNSPDLSSAQVKSATKKSAFGSKLQAKK